LGNTPRNGYGAASPAGQSVCKKINPKYFRERAVLPKYFRNISGYPKLFDLL